MKIAFIGDVYSDSNSSVKTDQEIINLLKACDHVICNLEGPIIDTPNNFERWPKAGPHLKQNKGVINLLKELNINTCSLSNNHIFDFGKAGLRSTQELLEKNNIAHFGAGRSESLYSPMVIKSPKIAIFGASEAQFGCMTDSIQNAEYGYAWILSRHLRASIKKFKEEGYYVIIYTHLGLEDINYPLPEWREVLKALCDVGANIIINTHTHTIQGKEYYNNSTIYHSLGNFYFNRNSKKLYNNQSLILIINFNESKIHVTEFFVESHNTEIKTLDYNSEFNNLSNKLLEPDYYKLIDKVLIEKWDLFYKSYYNFPQLKKRKFPIFHNFFSKLSLRLLRTLTKSNDTKLLQHNLQIETHRFAVERILRNINKTY